MTPNAPFRTPEQNRKLLDEERRAGFACVLRENIGNRMKFDAEQVLERITKSSQKIKGMKKYSSSFIKEAVNADRDRKKILAVVEKIHSMESQFV